MDCTIVKASPQLAQTLSELAFHSKAFWGYPDEFMAACREELTFSAEEINKNHCYVLKRGDVIIGFYLLENIEQNSTELLALFVEPDYIGKGYGRRLMQHAISTASELGASSITIQGDPHAMSFYLSLGAIPTGESESQSIPGRFLPTFVIEVGDNCK